MPDRLTVALVQLCATPDTAANLARLEAEIASAAADGAAIVCLPEYCAALGQGARGLEVAPQPEENHRALAHLSAAARASRVWLQVGSLGVTAPDGRVWNRSFLLDPEGEIRARYDKIHLFDVDLAAEESYRESAVVQPGERAVVAATPWGGFGLSVCYDLRFPQLYRALAQAGASVLLVPAAFTRTTGRAHWHVLLRARAIETGSFVVAAAQCGEAADGRLARYGHSLVVDPWGQVLADAGEAEGQVLATLELGRVAEARRRIPALAHDRPFERPTLVRAEGP